MTLKTKAIILVLLQKEKNIIEESLRAAKERFEGMTESQLDSDWEQTGYTPKEFLRNLEEEKSRLLSAIDEVNLL